MEIRDDLKTNPEYLNELIGILNGSFTLANDRIKELEKMIGNSDQPELIELQDKVEMLNRRFFAKGKESLNKARPPKEDQKELLPHNVSPVTPPADKEGIVPEVDVIHTEATCSCCGSTELEKMKGQFEESEENDLQAKSIIKKKHKKQKYRCKSCEKIVTAKGGAKVRPRS